MAPSHQEQKLNDMKKLEANTLFQGIHQHSVLEPKVRSGRDYWLNEILKHIQESEPKATFQRILWRINRNVKPANEEGVRALHFSILSSMKDPRCPYKNYGHAFNARTKVIHTP